MSESTLSLNYDELAGEVGFYAGWGRGANLGDPAWDTRQQKTIDSCVKTGLRKFYFPVGVEKSVYSWSFMRPIATMALVQNVRTANFPDDFGQFEGSITLTSPQGTIWGQVQIMSEGQVDQAYGSNPARTGRPLIAAISAIKGTSLTAGQRFQLLVFPLPDQAYTIQFQYYILPDFLTAALPYALGGATHAETIKEAVLAAAELLIDNNKGIHYSLFQEQLSASMDLDRRNKPQTLGPNLDRSDWTQDGRWRRNFPGIKVYGNQP